MSELLIAKAHFKLCGERWKLIPFYFNYMVKNYYCSYRIKRPFAICVDIDGTLKSDHPDFDMFPHVKDAIRALTDQDVHLCFITARSENLRVETETETLAQLNLKKDQYTLIMRSGHVDIPKFKEQSRMHLREKYHIPITIGDQLFDLNGIDEDENDACLNVLIENPFHVG